MIGVPIWERYLLTVSDAAKYFGIGEEKLRRIASESEDAPFIMTNGNRLMFKRKMFEKYLDGLSVI